MNAYGQKESNTEIVAAELRSIEAHLQSRTLGVGRLEELLLAIELRKLGDEVLSPDQVRAPKALAARAVHALGGRFTSGWVDWCSVDGVCLTSEMSAGERVIAQPGRRSSG